jgi:hypothetical protein
VNIRAASLFLLLVLCIAPHLNAQGRIERGRYFSPGDVFSIAMDPLYIPSNEITQPGLILVDFKFNPRLHQNYYVEARNIEWVTVQTDVTKDQYEPVARDLISIYKNQRLKDHDFNVVNSKLDSSGKHPHFEFIAHGKQKDAVFLWQGSIFFFGSRVAMVSSVYTPLKPLEPSQLTKTLPDKSFMGWARTIRPEGSLTAQNKP